MVCRAAEIFWKHRRLSLATSLERYMPACWTRTRGTQRSSSRLCCKPSATASLQHYLPCEPLRLPLPLIIIAKHLLSCSSFNMIV